MKALITTVLLTTSSIAFANGLTDMNFIHKDNQAKVDPYSHAYVSISDFYGYPRQDIKLTSDHYIVIGNSSGHDVTVNYTFYLCTREGGCVSKSFSHTVANGEQFRDGGSMEAHEVYQAAGYYDAYARTVITCDQSEYNFDETQHSSIKVVN